jgi:hypothetical protein
MTDTLDPVALLPCPFCGETPDINNPATFASNQGDKWGAVVCCCTGPEVRTGYQAVGFWMDDAITEWNRRALPQARKELVGRFNALVQYGKDSGNLTTHVAIADIREAASALSAEDGFVRVPREPTREMWAAGGNVIVGYKQRHHDKVVADVWSAMLAAAPDSN